MAPSIILGIIRVYGLFFRDQLPESVKCPLYIIGVLIASGIVSIENFLILRGNNLYPQSIYLQLGLIIVLYFFNFIYFFDKF
ncbi:hypothetical protein B9T50_07590 [Zymomonas mobilis subsp. mobilis]|nr:hypothetical protein B9T50_07590 [Zymomonas mobilis subsp. mobilis]